MKCDRLQVGCDPTLKIEKDVINIRVTSVGEESIIGLNNNDISIGFLLSDIDEIDCSNSLNCSKRSHSLKSDDVAGLEE